MKKVPTHVLKDIFSVQFFSVFTVGTLFHIFVGVKGTVSQKVSDHFPSLGLIRLLLMSDNESYHGLDHTDDFPSARKIENPPIYF